MGKSILSRLGEEIFQILKGSGKSLTLFNEDGKIVYDPSNASRMFVEPDKMMISIIRDGYNSSVCLYLSSGTDLNKSSLTKLITTLRTTSTRYNMLFNVKKFGYQLTPKDFSYLTATESVMDVRNVVETQLYGTTKSSYQKIGNARLVIRHSASVNEEKRGARGRHINALFVENNMGERFRYPHIHLSGGRAMAFHISQGGTFHDSVGQNIIGLSEQYYHLSNIRHYIRSNNLMENSAIEFSQLDKQLSQIRNICSRIQRPHGYNWFQQEYKPIITMDENQVVVLANKLNISENDELTNSLKWATGLTTTQLEDITMNVVAERELEQQDKFLTYAKDYYLKRLAKAGEPAVVSREVEKSSADLAKGLKEILSGRFSAKVIGKPRDDFKTPESEKSYKISMVLEPASGISNDALWNYISDISDKLGHGEKLTKNELLIADKIVAYVDRKLQDNPEKTAESIEAEEFTSLEDVVADGLAQGKTSHTIARELGAPVWKIAEVVNKLGQHRYRQLWGKKTVEAKLPELANIDEWFEQFDPNTVLSNVNSTLESTVGEIDETPYDNEPSDVEVTIFENEIEEWIRDVVANPVRYGVRLSAPEDVDQPGRIDPDFVSDVLGAVRQGIMISDELWKEDYFFSREEEIRLQIIGEIKKMYSDLTENELMEMPVGTQSFSTRISDPTSIVTSITPNDVKISRAIWNFLGGSDKIWAILEYNNTIIVVWGKREGNLYGERNWRKQQVSRAEALARHAKKLREGYREVIKDDRIIDPHFVSQLSSLVPFLKEIGARVFRTLDIKNTDLNAQLSTTESTVAEDSQNWTKIAGPTVDATGDMIHDYQDRYNLVDKVDSYSSNPDNEYSRNILVYMNPEKNIKMVCTPYWSGGDGETYSLTVYQQGKIDEDIKGWKHAGRDLAKLRASKGKNVKLVTLKKDGSESKMQDATKLFASEEEANAYHKNIVKLNPTRKIAHNLYVDGHFVTTLEGINEANQSQDFIDDIEYNDDEEITDNDIREMEESIKTMLRMAKVR